MKKIKFKTVIIFTDFYSPGYLAGGALRSIYNSVSILNNKIDFTIMTRGYDLFPKYKFNANIINKLISKNNTKIIYSYKKNIPDFLVLLFNAYKNRIFFKKFDILFLNSFFSPFASIFPLFLVATRILKCQKIIISPRGELNREGLQEKTIKKNIYIYIFKKLNFIFKKYEVTFHASDNLESNYIKNSFQDYPIKECIDPPANISPKTNLYKPSKSLMKIIFFSRISRKKNLKYLIKCLTFFKYHYKLKFDVIGPICDQKYWHECLDIVKDLPNNIDFNYLGNYSPKQIYDVLPKYDLFVFPTYGENYGHVIFESIRLGTPVLTTPFTPWTNEEGILNTLQLDNYEKWLFEIDKFFNMDYSEKIKYSKFISESIQKSRLLQNINKQHYLLFNIENI